MDKRNYSPKPALPGMGAIAALAGDAYWLEPGTTGPTRIVGRDAIGMPIEETVPAAYSRMFVGIDGCVKDVPMRTWAGTFSSAPMDVSYEQSTTRDMIMGGQLPLDECPHTMNYVHVIGGPLVPPGPGVVACMGAPGGCEHMKPIIEERLVRARAKYEREQIPPNTMPVQQVTQLMETAAVAFAKASSTVAPPPVPGRARLAANKGEQD